MRHLLPALVALAIFAPMQSLLAADSAYPMRPVRLIVPYPPGGGSDITGRAITSPQRHPLLPDTQTFVEAGVKDFVSFQWYGILGPAGMPKGIVATLNQTINKALAAPDVQERFAALTFDAAAGSPEDFRKLLVSEDQRWKDVLKQVKIRLD